MMLQMNFEYCTKHEKTKKTNIEQSEKYFFGRHKKLVRIFSSIEDLLVDK